MDSRYGSLVQALNWDALYKDGLGSFLETIREQWLAAYDFVLIDSRTGITDIGGICTIQLPDILVAALAPNWQNLNGVVEVISRATARREGLPLDRSGLMVLPVLCRLEQSEYELSRKWLSLVAERLGHATDRWRHRDVAVVDILSQTSIPYIPIWSYEEKLAVLTEPKPAPAQISFPIESIAALIAHRLENNQRFLTDRDSFIMEARGESPRPRMGAGIYISYRHSDSHDVVSRLSADLARHFGHDKVFLDKSRLEIGQDWKEQIEYNAKTARVMLIVIGQNWQSATFQEGDLKGLPRLFDSDDFVRREITLALDAANVVIPVLLNGTLMPTRGWLKNCGLERLFDLQAIRIRTTDYISDFTELKNVISKRFPELILKLAVRDITTSNILPELYEDLIVTPDARSEIERWVKNHIVPHREELTEDDFKSIQACLRAVVTKDEVTFLSKIVEVFGRAERSLRQVTGKFVGTVLGSKAVGTTIQEALSLVPGSEQMKMERLLSLGERLAVFDYTMLSLGERLAVFDYTIRQGNLSDDPAVIGDWSREVNLRDGAAHFSENIFSNWSSELAVLVRFLGRYKKLIEIIDKAVV